MKKNKLMFMSLIALGLNISTQAEAHSTDLSGYYIGIDSAQTLTRGTYTGLSNPNYGRLTLLYNHGDHYHGIGTYSYTGSSDAATIVDTNANNRIPETYTNEAPLQLSLGSGSLYNGKLTSQNNTSEYGNLKFELVDSLAGHDSGSEEFVLFNSSNGRWNTLLGNTSIGLQLISATPGLYIGDENTANLFASSDTVSLNSYLQNGIFSPIFWTAIDAAIDTFTAEFRLVGLEDANINSGRFYFDVKPVPVPGAVWLFLSGLLSLIGMSRTRNALKG